MNEEPDDSYHGLYPYFSASKKRVNDSYSYDTDRSVLDRAMIPKNKIPILASDQFTWDETFRTFYTSCTKFDHWELITPIFNDTIDAGIGIRSVETDRIVYFICTGSERNRETTEIAGWWFDVLRDQDIKNMKIWISND